MAEHQLHLTRTKPAANGLVGHPGRIIDWFGLEGTLKLIWFQLPCHEHGITE